MPSSSAPACFGPQGSATPLSICSPPPGDLSQSAAELTSVRSSHLSHAPKHLYPTAFQLPPWVSPRFSMSRIFPSLPPTLLLLLCASTPRGHQHPSGWPSWNPGSHPHLPLYLFPKTRETPRPGISSLEPLVCSPPPYVTSRLHSSHCLVPGLHPARSPPPNHPLQAARDLSKTLL